jgi:uncharacterized protein GlcG (DUF336 family)/tetratricopeptide (TPR) repeat protein
MAEAAKTKETITLEEARRVIDGAARKAEEIGQPMDITVVDAGGNLKAHVRMDGAFVGSITISINKAYTAIAFQQQTAHLQEDTRPGGPIFGLSDAHGGCLVVFPGGIPLAIELAAARTKVLSVEEISSHLGDSFRLLAAGSRTAMPRQRTLHATMDWSHELLSQKERALFRRLSVFAGGFTLKAAESVYAGEDLERNEVLDLLSHLVDKSLVIMWEDRTGTRYRLLETIRQYGKERLEEVGEAAHVRERHAGYYLAVAEEAEPALKGKRQVAWLEREHENLRATMAWLLDRGESEEAARLGWALWLFWGIRTHLAEGRRSMERALSARGSVAMSASARAKALFVAGMMSNYQGDHLSAEPLVQESLRLFKELGDKLGTAYALSNAGYVALGRGRYQQAIAVIEDAADLFLEEGEKWGAAIELGFLAVAWRNQGDQERAKRLAEPRIGNLPGNRREASYHLSALHPCDPGADRG